MIKNILITGGAGYIGSHIAENLIKAKKKVYIVDNLSTGFKRLVNKDAKFFKLNILNTLALNRIILKYKIDTIVHLAANLIIGDGEKNPKKFYKNNVQGTLSLIKALKKSYVKNLLFSSTAAVYKDGMYRVTENSVLQPKSVYGKTKLRAENLIKSNCKKLKVNYGILRYFNIVGASPSGKYGLINISDHLFKNFSKEIIKKNPVLKIYGNNYNTKDGSCIRDFIHVSDIAKIHEKVLYRIDKLKKSVILNCGYNQGISVKQVANEFKKHTNKKVKIIEVKKRSGDLGKIIASNARLLKFISWRPKYKKLSLMVKSSIKWEKKLKSF